ncbi:MAG TPA: xylulokinase [Pyrinomonadaceae bacterium]|nr:xylulokinase [Pyrinomonadaceae bacterium]
MHLLGLDIGTGGTRAVVIDAGGKLVASSSADHAPFSSPRIGWAEQDPNEWWRAATAAIRAVLENVPTSQIAAVGLSGQMHGAVVLDERDEPVRPALMWCDQRTGEQCRNIIEQVRPERLTELVANPAVTAFTLPKLLWLRQHEPENWSRVTSVLLPKDYIRLKLSGDRASDVTDASGTLLFDVANREWSGEMFSLFELDPVRFPRAFESVEVTGRVNATGAEATGLEVGTVIVAGAGDNAAGAIGLGIVSPGMLSATIGTSGVAFLVTDGPQMDPAGRIHTMCHAVPGRWHNTGVTQSAGLSLKWYRENFGYGRSFDELVDKAAVVPPGADGLIWLPYLMGERTPHMDPNARAALIGLTASHTEGHVVRALLEGVAFSLRDSIEIFAELGTAVESVRLGGGGAKSALWRKIQADVYKRRVESASRDEGAAFGAALLAGVGAGVWPTVEEACDVAIMIDERLEPDAAGSEVLDRNYKAYRKLYPALRPVIEELTGNPE